MKSTPLKNIQIHFSSYSRITSFIIINFSACEDSFLNSELKFLTDAIETSYI